MKGLASVVVGASDSEADVATRATGGTGHHFRWAVHLGEFASFSLGWKGKASAPTLVTTGRVLLGVGAGRAAGRVHGSDYSSNPT